MFSYGIVEVSLRFFLKRVTRNGFMQHSIFTDFGNLNA